MWVTDHARLITVVWLLVIVGLGAFAPKVEAELSGAGWQADPSESVAARELAQDHALLDEQSTRGCSRRRLQRDAART